MTAPTFLAPRTAWEDDLQSAVWRVLESLWTPPRAAAVELAVIRGDVDLALQILLGSLDDNVTFPRWSPVASALQRLLMDRTESVAQREIGERRAYAGAAGPGMRVRFDLGNVHAWDQLRNYQFGLIRGLDHETREGVRTWVRTGLQKGWNPRETARGIKGIIGLTDRQASAVANYRAMLLARDGGALQRKLRDKRSDSPVRGHVAGLRTLRPEEINRLVRRYEERYKQHRAETIARTETMRATGLAQRAMWESAVHAGLVDPQTHEKRWVTRIDGRERPEHHLLNGTRVKLLEEFKLPLSGGTTWGPPHDINCRCTCWIREVV